MIQIIGFLGCLYLFVKGLEILSQERQNGASQAASALALIGAFGFAIWLYIQGNAANDAMGPFAPFATQDGNVDSSGEAEADVAAAEAAADDALKAADEAIANAEAAIENAKD